MTQKLPPDALSRASPRPHKGFFRLHSPGVSGHTHRSGVVSVLPVWCSTQGGRTNPPCERFGPCAAVRSRPAAPLPPAAGKLGFRAAPTPCQAPPPGGLWESTAGPRARLQPRAGTESLPASLAASGRGWIEKALLPLSLETASEDQPCVTLTLPTRWAGLGSIPTTHTC